MSRSLSAGARRRASRSETRRTYPFRVRSVPSACRRRRSNSIQQGIASSLKDSSASFGGSYRAGLSANSETVVCGYVNGKKFVGMFAKPAEGPTEFLPIGVSINQEEEDAVKTYCRTDGIYLPR